MLISIIFFFLLINLSIEQEAIPFANEEETLAAHRSERYLNATAYSQAWLEERDELFNDRGILTRLTSSKLLSAYFLNDKNQKARSNKRMVPIDVEARVIELKNPELQTSLWSQESSTLGYRNNIFTFWDDPLCDSYVFPNGLYVCGDARIRGIVNVISGVNITAIIDQRYDTPRPKHIHSRCTINPAHKLPHNTPWCYLSITARQADIYVLNSLEVTGNLYTKSLRIEGGSKAFVGLRGLVYTNSKYVGKKFTNFIMEYLYKNNIVDKEKVFTKKEASTNKTSPLYHERLTIKEYFELERKQAEEFEKFLPLLNDTDTENDTTEQDTKNTQNPYMAANLKQFEQLALSISDLRQLKCPLIDLNGTIVILRKLNNGTIIRQTEFETDNVKDNSKDYKPGFQQHVLLTSDFKPLTANSYQANVENSDLFENSIFGKSLPAYPNDVTLGDLNTLGVITVKDASLLWVYGNFIGAAAFIDTSSDFHLHCGHFFTNVSHPLGVTAVKASAVTSGGLMESVASQLVSQASSNIMIAGSAILTKFVQVFKASQAHIAGELLTGLVSINKASNLTVASMVEVESVMDISEGSLVTFYGSFGIGTLQIVDISKFYLYSPPLDKAYKDKKFSAVAIVENSLILDENSEAEFADISLFVRQSVNIGNRSKIYILDGDLEVENEGVIRIHGSDIFVGKNILAPKASLLVTSGSNIIVKGSVKVSGITAKEALLAKKAMKEKKDSKENSNKMSPVNLNNTNVTNKINDTETQADKTNEPEDSLDTMSKPAIYLEASIMYVMGVVENRNSWIDLSKGATLSIGLGLFSLSSNSTLIRVKEGSTLTVQNGPLIPGAALFIAEGSEVNIINGTLIAAGTIDITDKSRLFAKDIRATDSVSLHGMSLLNATNVFIVDGEALHVSSRSKVICGELRQIGGYIFVEDGGLINVHTDTLWALGSIVAQDKGVITVDKGFLVTIKGDIVIENFSELFVDEQAIILHSSHVNSVLSKNDSSEIDNLPKIDNIDLASIDFSTIPKNFISRTTESIIHTNRLVPNDTEIHVYVQAIPRLLVNATYNETVIPSDSKKTPDQLVNDLIEKPNQNNENHSNWSTIKASRDAVALESIHQKK